MPKRNNKRNRRRSRRGRFAYEEVFTFSVASGSSVTITSGTLANRPPRSNYRPLWMEVECRGFQPASSTLPGFDVPVGVQVGFSEGNTDSAVTFVSTSRLRVTPCRLRVNYPRSADWRSFDLPSNAAVGYINAVCVSAGQTAYLQGTCRMMIALQVEDIVPTCPTMLTGDGPGTSSTSSFTLEG